MSRPNTEITKSELVANLLNMVKLPEGWPPKFRPDAGRSGRTVLSGGPPPRPEGGTVMPLIALAIAALAIGFEQLIQWEYGPMGIIAFVALSVGLKARNATVSGIGAVILVMLLAQSG